MATVIFDPSPTFEWMNVVVPLLSATMGAIVGGGIAYLIARQSSVEIKRRDQETRLDRQKFNALHVLVKLKILVDSLASTHCLIEGQIAKADKDDDCKHELWKIMIPIIGISKEEIRFRAEEISVLFAAKEYDLISDLFLLAERHASLMVALQTYSERRLRMTDKMSADVDGTVAVTELDPNQKKFFRPKMVELNHLAEQIRTITLKCYQSALSIAPQVGKAMKSHFNDAAFPALDLTGAPLPIVPAKD